MSQRPNADDIPKVTGRLMGIELQNFMCHRHLKLVFDVTKSNCYYIIGPNGSGKSALFAGINIGLGGKGRSNDRGNSLQAYIKEGERQTKIRVTLSNEGPNPIPEYGKEIIVERTINPTASTYALKTKRGNSEEVKSRRKGDLDAILRRFNIELDNPLSWLSQDRSRQFLQQMKPDKLYNIFMISTELESTEQIYETIVSYMEETQAHIDAGEEKKIQLKEEYEKMFHKLKSAIKIEELSKKRSKLEWLLLWAVIRDNQKLLEDEGAKLEKLAEKRAAFETEAITFEERKRILDVEKDSLLEKVEVLRGEYSEHRAQYDDFNSKLGRTERNVHHAKDVIQRKNADVQAADREIQQTQIQLNRLIGDSNRDLVTEEKVLIEHKNEVIAQLTKLAESAKSAEEKQQHLDKNRQEQLKRCQSNEFELRQLKEKLNRVEEDKQLFLSARKDRVALLGQDMPKICQLVQANQRMFKKLPIGPLGMHIKLKNMKWANPVEFCLRKSLNNFICDSQHDRQVFERICRENRVKAPDLITTRFVDEKVNTAENEPSEELETVLRVIEVENATVYNALVDQYSLEDFLLIETDDEARKLMQQRPPRNARQALTMNCSQVYPATGNRPYRFYNNSNANDARFLVKDPGFSKRDFALEARQITEEISRQSEIVSELNTQATHAKNEFLTAQRDSKAMSREKQELEHTLKELDEKNEELQKTMHNGKVIENLKAVLEESHQLREQHLNELANAKNNLNDCFNEKQRVNLELTEATNNLKKVDIESRRIDKLMGENDRKREELLDSEASCINKLKKCDTLRTKFEESIRTLESKKAPLIEDCERNKMEHLKPDDFDDPPDFSKICGTDAIRTKLEEYDTQISTQRQLNRQNIPTQEQLEKLREVCKRHNTRLKQFRCYLKRFKDAVDIRREKLNLLKFALPHNLARSFKEQMLMRNYNGSLQVDHDARVIILSVETHNRNENVAGEDEGDNEMVGSQRRRLPNKQQQQQHQTAERQRKRVVQDLKGLSGGERSYTTACFVMALWECVESPFRCLDEFDVFMDMLNRRVVMEMLVDLAMEHKRNQFFFFTPQGINELKSRSNIEIFNLPRVRA